MNNEKLEETPKSLAMPGENLVAVRMILPEPPDAITSVCFPGSNYIGSQLFHFLAVHRLEARGHQIKGSWGCLPFNRSIHLFELRRHSDQAPALATLFDLLLGLMILDFAQIGWYDFREAVWRLYHPQTGEFKFAWSAEFQNDQLSRLLSEVIKAASLKPKIQP